ncbi:MAG: DUF4010 domain-containing protein [Bacteroidetes bacterium]|nr:DUF4010 domain-containing protein [Bacteroidota bacterium]
MELINTIPKDLVTFLLVTVFSLLIGLSQKLLHSHKQSDHTFGTDRTFTFIGILGYILFRILPGNPALFIGGGLILGLFLGINYAFNIQRHEDHGMTTIVIALITYCIGPLLLTQPQWLVLLILVTVLILTELKESFDQISHKFDKGEFLTLGKFLIIAGVILPIVPNEPIFRDIGLTAYKIWLAVVVVSSISYFSYLLKKFVFKEGSIVLAGILGGLYSSTATTIILARKIRKDPASTRQYVAAIIFATAMMYLRILVLVLIFNADLFRQVLLYFIILFVVSSIAGLVILFYHNKDYDTVNQELTVDKNPLEFKVAILFAFLFVAFTFLTWFVVDRFGRSGLNVLSFLVGLTDIDPFLINLLQGKYKLGMDAVAVAMLQAIVSNNILKLIYASFFSTRRARVYLISCFVVIILLNLFFVFIV